MIFLEGGGIVGSLQLISRTTRGPRSRLWEPLKKENRFHKKGRMHVCEVANIKTTCNEVHLYFNFDHNSLTYVENTKISCTVNRILHLSRWNCLYRIDSSSWLVWFVFQFQWKGKKADISPLRASCDRKKPFNS